MEWVGSWTVTPRRAHGPAHGPGRVASRRAKCRQSRCGYRGRGGGGLHVVLLSSLESYSSYYSSFLLITVRFVKRVGETHL